MKGALWTYIVTAVVALVVFALVYAVWGYCSSAMFASPPEPEEQPSEGVHREGKSKIKLMGSGPFMGSVASGSPFVDKVHVFLRACKVEFEHKPCDVTKAPRHKVRLAWHGSWLKCMYYAVINGILSLALKDPFNMPAL